MVLVAWPLMAMVVAVALAGRPVHRRRWVLLAMVAETALAATALATALSSQPVETADDWVRLRLGLDWAFRLDVPRTVLLLPALLCVTVLARRAGASIRLWATLPVMAGISAVLLGVDAGMQALAGVGIVVACEVARRFPIRRRWTALRCVGATVVLAGVAVMAGIHFRRTGYLSFLAIDLAWMHYGPAHEWLRGILVGGLLLRMGGAVLPFLGDGDGETPDPLPPCSPETDTVAEPSGPASRGSRRWAWLGMGLAVELAVTLGLGLSLLERMFAGPWDVFADTVALPASDAAAMSTMATTMGGVSLALAGALILLTRRHVGTCRTTAFCGAVGWLTLGMVPLTGGSIACLAGLVWLAFRSHTWLAVPATVLLAGLTMVGLTGTRKVLADRSALASRPEHFPRRISAGRRLLIVAMATASLILGIWPGLGL